METFETKKHQSPSNSEELALIFNQENEDFDEVINQNRDLVYDFKVYFRLLRKKFGLKFKEKFQKNFTNVLYLSLDCPPFTQNSSREDSPLEYITQMSKQYPDKSFRVIIPIIGLDREEFKLTRKIIVEIDNKQKILEKTSINFNFFIQNRVTFGTLYKFPKNNSNIQVYGLFSPSFSFCRDISMLTKIQFLGPFMRTARIAIKKLGSDRKEAFKPDIVHCENIPFFLGAEFESKLPYPVKVLQTIKDFTQIDMIKIEPFWAGINLADKRGMQKISKDKEIKKLIAELFKLHHSEKFYQIKECLRFIYKNYSKFRRYIDKGDDIEENVIFNKLNERIVKLFPELGFEGENYFNLMSNTLKRTDFWITTSETYYKEIFESPENSGKMYKLINKTKTKSDYVSLGASLEKFPLEGTREVYQSFNSDNFRELRKKNKTAILKEFSPDRIKTNFVDPTLFKGNGVKIYGNLDTIFDTPLLFANLDSEIFANGVDILFNSILKLFELHKNIQVIIAMNNGMKIGFVKTWIEFLAQNKYFNGKWVFIDGQISPSKFLAASDMILIPRRANMISIEHFVAMHYGCVPIISRSGILNDTIADIFDDITNGCGFKTKTALLTEEDNNEIFVAPLLKALNLYQNNPSSWNLLVKNCLKHNSSWDFRILERYNKVYEEIK